MTDKKKTQNKMFSPFLVTKEQHKWIERRSKKTAQTMAAVVRGLIQEKMESEK